MRRPDDEMKIEISELFGGELNSPHKTGETAAAGPSGAHPTPEEHAARETKFQEWMNNREKELELKAQELERRLHEIHAQQNLETSSPSLDLAAEVAAEPEPAAAPQPEAAIVAEAPAPLPEPPPFVEPIQAAEPPPPPEAAPQESLIDFSAPIAPPFMGAPAVLAAASAEAAPSAETSASSAPTDAPKTEELKKLQADHEFLMLYDEFRNIIAHELKDLVGEKKTFTMLGRTVELARGKFPEIFRNANWDAAGNLLEDGSVESQRIIDNKNALDAQRAELVLDTALSALLNLRLQAVEKGLGAGLRNKVRANLYQWITEKLQKTERDGKDPAILRRLNGYVSQVE